MGAILCMCCIAKKETERQAVYQIEPNDKQSPNLPVSTQGDEIDSIKVEQKPKEI